MAATIEILSGQAVSTLKSVGEELAEYRQSHPLSPVEMATALSSIGAIMEQRRRCAEKDPELLGNYTKSLTLEEYGELAIEQYYVSKMINSSR